MNSIFYETTTASLGFDGNDGPGGPANATLGRFGHSKAGPWAPQVVVALTVTRAGVP